MHKLAHGLYQQMAVGEHGGHSGYGYQPGDVFGWRRLTLLVLLQTQSPGELVVRAVHAIAKGDAIVCVRVAVRDAGARVDKLHAILVDEIELELGASTQQAAHDKICSIDGAVRCRRSPSHTAYAAADEGA